MILALVLRFLPILSMLFFWFSFLFHPQDPIEDDLELPSVVQAVHRTILLQQKADQRHRLSLQSEEVRVRVL